MDSIFDLLKKNNIKPNNKNIYLEALSHPSYANEKDDIKSYQRLEFLGDSILSKLSAEKTYELYSKADEGKMTIIRSNAVNGKQLAIFSRELGLNKLIKVGNNNEHLKDSDKVLEDVFEALVAAIYLDQGEQITKRFLNKNVFAFIERSKNKNLKNPKTILQEYLQAESREIIKYETEKSGDGFISKIFHDGNYFGCGEAPAKKEAEVKAAIMALEKLGKEK